MKAIASVAIAGILAATSLATTTVTADAGGKHHKNYYKHHHSGGYNPGAAFATGAILGLTFGALSAPTYYYPPPVYYYPPPPPLPPPPRRAYYSYGGDVYAQHVSWCSSRYRSYNAEYNTWVDYDGFVHECVSPIPY
jgi:hypothetical protein